ncbi:MAG: arsenic resistance N-acetyltransferase ArsN2 [Sinimarinibacterium sp.]
MAADQVTISGVAGSGRIGALPDISRLSCDARVAALLAACGLPTSDLEHPRAVQLFGIVEARAPVAVCGLEVHGTAGLLRSLAVAGAQRGRGLGYALVRHAEIEAAKQGVIELYLLTTTAADFFARLGYAPTPRAEAPAAIAQTTQFSSLCPASSAFMRKALTPPC